MCMTSEFLDRLCAQIPTFSHRQEEPLSAHCSFRIGGPAELMLFPRDISELQTAVTLLYRMGCKPFLLGAGTNVLFPDEGLRGVVIVTRDCLTGLKRPQPARVEAMAGNTLSQAAMYARDLGLSGLEFAHGIPGTVGGGVYMNAGAYGGEIRQVAWQTEFMYLDGTINIMRGDEQEFGYRTSTFQKRDCVILRTWFDLTPAPKEEIRARMQELAEKRRASQPLELPSAGSAFKRPAGGFAAALIEQAGLKGVGVGGAAVSEKHAGFLVNLGGASAEDVKQTIALVQKRVYETSGILLEPEIRIL